MTKNTIITLLLLSGLALMAFQGPTLLAAPPQHTPATPEPTEEPLEETADEVAEGTTGTVAAEPAIAELVARIDALQAQVNALAAGTNPGLVNEVTTAVYLLDNAGLHGLDERLNDEGLIQASDAGRVARIARVLSSVDWPAPLAEEAEALVDTLNQLAEALRADDLEAAAPLGTQAHVDQHAFSHTAEHWLRDLTHGHGDEVSDHGNDTDDEEESTEDTEG